MIQSLARAFRLLELLDRAGDGGMALGGLADQAGLKPPTTRNFLTSLTELGYVRQDLATRRYYLGRRAQALGTQGMALERLRRAAALAVPELQAEVHETVLLAAEDDGLRRTIVTAESELALKVGARETADTHFYSTATGRLLLAQMPESERHVLLRRLGAPSPGVWDEAADPAALANALAELRRQGACAYDRTGSHIVALAVTVPLPGEAIRAALGLYFPDVRDHAGRRDTLLARLRVAAGRIGTEYERS